MAERVVAIDVTRVRFLADASLVHRMATLSNRCREYSATGTRTRVAQVRAEYLNQLDYSGFCHTLDKRTRASADLLHARSAFGDPPWSIRETAALLLGCNAIELAWRFLCSAEWHPFPVEHIGQPATCVRRAFVRFRVSRRKTC